MKDIKQALLDFNVQVNGDSSLLITKLMQENRWSKKFALSAFAEYKKFLYLLYLSNARLSPSIVIDKVWHCHLTFTHSYWHELCRDILGREIHHIPSSKDRISQAIDLQDYKKALALYTIHFGQPDHYIWGDVTDIKPPKEKKPHWVWLLFASMFLTACSLQTNGDITDLFLWILGAYIVYRIIKWLMNNNDGGRGSGSGGSGCGSSCGGGCGGS